MVSVEIDPTTLAFAKRNVEKAGYQDILLVAGDGGLGYAEASPYDRIAVTAACNEIPPPLIEQLRTGGKIIAPVFSDEGQDLVLLIKLVRGARSRVICKVLYVPLRGVHAGS